MSDLLPLLVSHLAELLSARDWKLATAESCTGGWVAKILTDGAGSSDWFERGLVTYSDGAKVDLLGVSADSLAEHGAVSEAVAREMVIGALSHSRAQVALAITGIAGPGGGSAEKPVGTVWLAWLVEGGEPLVERRRFLGGRDAVRRQSVELALQGMVDLLTRSSA